MRYLILAGLVLTAGTVAAAADPEFHPYESRQPLIKEGQGGERTTTDGIDIWVHGDPPKRYQVLGSLSDDRRNFGYLFGIVPNPTKRLSEDIAKAAKAAGGDAAILETEENVITGYYDDRGNDGGGNVTPLRHHQSRYLVVKYLPDLPSGGGQQSGQ